MFTYEDISDFEDKEASEKEFSENIYESALDEKPYINDPNQLNFYFSRNLKSMVTILVFFYLTFKGLQLFWESLRLLITNLL